MFSRTNFNGSDLPPKTLCLTYDDGPGAHTYDIAKFLHEHQIQATFFVVGKYAYHNQDILAQVMELGHTIGNHTHAHPDMPYYQSMDGELQYQIIKTDLLIKKFVREKKIYFRAPYGKWSGEVADELNSNILSALNHVGPIHWDIAGIDCYYWENGFSIDDTVERYLKDIRAKGHGIIVMHDEIADMDVVKSKNQTLELTKRLVPLLLAEGYTFVNLEKVESIQKEVNEIEKFSLRSLSNGDYLQLASRDSMTLNARGSRNNDLSDIVMTDLGFGKVALMAANGKYFNSINGSTDGVMANSSEIGPFESFDLIQLRDNQVIFRSNNGNYLSIDKSSTGAKLKTDAEFMRQAEIFTFLIKGTHKVKRIPFRKRLYLFKKRILFVKSKIIHG